MTLLSRLFVLVAVALLPAIAIQAYGEYDLRRARTREVQDQAVSLAKLAAAEQLQIVQGIRQVLVALSELPAVKKKDSQACNAYLASLKERFPAFLTFLVTDLHGKSFCDTNLDHKPVDVSHRGYFARVMQTSDFTVGEFSLGLSTGRRVIQFVLPFYDYDGHMEGAIVAGFSLDWLADHIAQKGVPGGAAIAVTDRNGTYLARFPDNDRFAGKKMPAGRSSNADGATADITGLDGVERIVGFSALGADAGGLLVSFGINKAHAFAEIQRRTERGIFLIILSTSLVLILTAIGARRFIHRPLGQLAEAANEWRHGDYARRVNLKGKGELSRVAEAFNIMADALKHREQELYSAKEKAESAAARITTIFESTTDSVLILDREWRITYLNMRAVGELAEGRNVVGMLLREAFTDDSYGDVFHQLEVAMLTRRATSLEAFCIHRDAWFTLNAYPSDQGLALYFRNITEHKKALEARRVMEEQLHQSQKMEAAGQLTGGIAHDFNNLLTVVAVNLEAIESGATDDRVRQLAAAAQLAADRGAKLTAQLLAFSRRQRLEPKLVSVNHIIEEFEGLIARAVGAECEVRLSIDEQLWLCYIDPAQLQTALLNLALNARDAMEDGGVLEIETRNVELDKGAVPGCLPGSYVRLSVRDTGRGMPPDVRDRVFEPFFTTKEVGKGTGLGLSMVYGFVRQSGGDVAIQSAPGVGTTVILYLPKAAQNPNLEAKGGQAQGETAGTERILLVEDDEGILGVVSEMLTDLGYQVFPARNGPEAIRLLDSGQEFELLFSDIIMPNGMNGVELAREAKRRNKGIKVLLTSGYARDVLERNRAVDEFPIIGKPYRRADLAQTVRSVLQDA